MRGGRAVAAGDINGDGYDDVVVGQPDKAESAGNKGGQVTVVPGSASGLTATGARTTCPASVSSASRRSSCSWNRMEPHSAMTVPSSGAARRSSEGTA